MWFTNRWRFNSRLDDECADGCKSPYRALTVGLGLGVSHVVQVDLFCLPGVASRARRVECRLHPGDVEQFVFKVRCKFFKFTLAHLLAVSVERACDRRLFRIHFLWCVRVFCHGGTINNDAWQILGRLVAVAFGYYRAASKATRPFKLLRHANLYSLVR